MSGRRIFRDQRLWISENRGAGLRVGHDALFGVGAGCFEQLLAGTTCRVLTLNGQRPALWRHQPEPLAKNYVSARRNCGGNRRNLPRQDGDSDRSGRWTAAAAPSPTRKSSRCCCTYGAASRRRGECEDDQYHRDARRMSRRGAALTEVGIASNTSRPRCCRDVIYGAEESGSIGSAGTSERDGAAVRWNCSRSSACRCGASSPAGEGVRPHRYGGWTRRCAGAPRGPHELLRRDPRRGWPVAVVAVKTFDGVNSRRRMVRGWGCAARHGGVLRITPR